MFALAVVLFDDTDTSDAEAVVLRAFLDSCTPVELACSPASRHELARYVYVLWLRHGAAKSDMRAIWAPLTRRRRPTGLAPRSRLSQLQRTTLALGLFGEHTYQEIASLTDVAAQDVAALMRSGLLLTIDTRD